MHMVSTNEFCRVFGITRRTVYNWQNKGKLEPTIVATGKSEHYMWDIHQFCIDNKKSWRQVKEILEFRADPESLTR